MTGLSRPYRFRALSDSRDDIQSVAGRQLHPGGQFVVANPGFEHRLVRVIALVQPIQLGQELEVVPFGSRGRLRRRAQIQDGRSLAVELGATMHRGQPTILPERGAGTGIPFRIAEHNEGRQVFVFASQSVADPRAQRGSPGQNLAAGDHHQRFGVVVMLTVHRADEAQVVGDRAQMRQHFGNLGAALTARLKLERARQQRVPFAPRLEHFDFVAIYGACVTRDAGLGSNSSIWLGPPFCSSMITALARG